ncbi:MAG: YfhO family protein [Lachnospiraceae bacterium]|nr:YfhO family protein [Lachnospiraceae bacterium]
MMLFILCKIAGAILIFAVWRFIYHIGKERDYASLIILLIAACISILHYPNVYLVEMDNVFVYYMTKSYYPYYWHSIYIQLIYGACLMLFRHAIMVIFVQLSLFLSALLYLFRKLREHGHKKLAYAILLFAFIPENLYYCDVPYRNNYYGILFFWFLLTVCFTIVLDKKQLSKGQIVLFLLFGALLTVIRGEAILNVPLILILCYYLSAQKDAGKKKRIAETLKLSAIYVTCCILLLFPQKAGEYKYFGKDYQIINHTNIVQSILLDPNANLSYAGANEDILAISDALPMDYLLNMGMYGFYVANYENSGRITQSLLPIEKQSAFLSAANRLERNNIPVVFSTRLSWFIRSNGGPVYSRNKSNLIKPLGKYKESCDIYDIELDYGKTNISESFGTDILTNSALIAKISKALMDNQYLVLCGNLGIVWILRILSFIVLIVLELQLLSKHRMTQDYLFHAVSLIILAQWAAIFAAAPEMRFSYYYTAFYLSVFWDIILSAHLISLSHKPITDS